MESIVLFFDRMFEEFARADFALLLLIDIGAFAFISVMSIAVCVFSQRVRGINKRPFIYLVDLFTAITLIVFLIRYTLPQACT